MTDTPNPATLPVVAWRIEWQETDPRDPGNWVQWHGIEEPPGPWDDEEPTEIIALTAHAPAQAVIDELERVLAQQRETLGDYLAMQCERDELRAQVERLRHDPIRQKAEQLQSAVTQWEGIYERNLDEIERLTRERDAWKTTSDSFERTAIANAERFNTHRAATRASTLEDREAP